MKAKTVQGTTLTCRKDQKKSRFKATLVSFKKTKFLHFLILPGIIYFIIFMYIPIYGITIAFKDFDFRAGIMGSPWVGLKHFVKFFGYQESWNIIKNTFLLSLYSHFWTFFPPIILALFLNELTSRKYKSFVQTVSYLPHFISSVAVVGMVSLILAPQGGFVNDIIQKLGGEPIYFMAEKRWFRSIYVLTGGWQTTGWSAIIYISALSSVDSELYEAASIDGATRLQKMFRISLPCIKETIILLLIMNIGKMMNASTDKVLLLQQPITYEVSDVIGTYIYRRGLVNADYSYSTAVGLFNTVINLALVLGANFISKKYSEVSLF